MNAFVKFFVINCEVLSLYRLSSTPSYLAYRLREDDHFKVLVL